jgi:acetyltransferase
MAERQIMQYADVARAAVRAASNGKPVVVFSHVSGGLDGTIKGILDEGNVPFLQGSRESLLAIHHLIGYAEYQRRRKSEPIEGAPPPHLKEMIEGFKGARRVLSYDKTKELLSAYGIRVAKAVLAGSVEAALEGADHIGYPVAVKAQSPHLPHKTEDGLVRLNIKDGPELSASFEEMAEKVHRHAPEAALEGILIQQMVSSEAVEVILGISRDPSFGPVVALGMGGLLVELLKDICIQLPPIDFDDVYAMISRLKGRDLLQGFRGRDSADVDALAHAVVQVGRMAIELKDVLFSLDLNPLMVLPGKGGVVAVDMVLEVGG